MDKLTRLVIRARQAAKTKEERFCVGFVCHYRPEDPYIAKAAVWNGKKGSGRMIVSSHETEQDAIDALYSVYNEYPNITEDAVIFTGDIEV